MGVDITTQVGYGFAVSEDDWNQYLSLNGMEDESWEAGHALARKKPGIGYAPVGNFMSGENIHAVFYV